MEYEIKPREKIHLGMSELWQSRELFYFFTLRDIKVKYKQTVLGFLWAIIQPIFMVVVFTVFISDSIVMRTNLAIPYPLFAFSGMLLWTLFSSGMSNAANSMVNNSNIIKKIYFPRLIIPISSVFVALVDFLVAFIVFVLFVLFMNYEINFLKLFLLPLSIIITLLASIGCGTLLASLNLKYRDVRYVIPFLVQGLLFLTPVLFPINISNNRISQIILKINPISGALELYRGIFIGYSVDYNVVFYSLISSSILFFTGVLFFRNTEAYFADLA